MNEIIGEKSVKCIRCGFCLDACPTFRLTGNEAESPRGRIYLMRSVSEGQMPMNDGVRKHIDSCLGCRACESACPSGVEYADILEHFRADMETNAPRPLGQRIARKQLLETLTNPGVMAASLKANALLTRITGAKGTKLPGIVASLLSGKSTTAIKMPAVPAKIGIGKLPELSLPIGEERYRVGMLQGCVMRVLFHETNEATLRVLQRHGCRVEVHRDAECCGALHLHSGFMQDALFRARRLLDAVNIEEIDAFVVNSAGCGSTLKEYGKLFADNPEYADRAARFASKVRDISEWLMEIGIRVPAKPFKAVIAYHDACHLAHGQQIRTQPRDLIQAIPGVELIELEESEMCCGSAGTYNLTQPEMAAQLQERKLDNIVKCGAEIIATGNPGCLAWIEQGIQERGLKIRVMHPVDILDHAYGGESA